MYLEQESDQVNKSEFSPDETRNLKANKVYYEKRIFPVPRTVDPSGKVFMGAHFRLTQDNGKAMRMHIHDATAVDGKVYIGYLGPHPPSRRTN
jgi:hypothetical protein